MEQSTQPKRRKRVAKNRKKAWRKHSNIQDVEDFMDDQRMQLRTGGLVSEKPDESLFFVDNRHPVHDEDDSKKTLEKPLKIDRKLMPDPRIPVARLSKTPRSLERPKRKSKLVQRLEAEGRWGPSSSAKRRKLITALKNSDEAEREKDDDQKRRESGRAVYDLWADQAPTTKTEATPNEHFLRVTKKTRKKLPKTYYNKTSCYNAVEVVPAGASYNPSFEDHQELIQKAVQVEVDREKKEEKLNRWHQFAKISRGEMERNNMKEMSEGLFDEGHHSEEDRDGDEDDDDVLPSAPVVAERRKTRRQRNKEREIKQQLKKARTEKADKIRLNEVYRLRSLKREIREKEKKIEAKIKQRKAKAKENEGRTKRLGRYKYEELPIPVKLSEHLVGSLRQLKPEGNMIVDRFNNLEKRNMIAPRIWKKGTKPKMKEYEKKSFKEIKLAE